MPDGKLKTYFFGYPPGANDSPVPLFQAYLESTIDDISKEALKNALQRQLPYTLRGQHTLQFPLDDEGVQKAQSAILNDLEVAERASKQDIIDAI